jgi:vitellogenic carboxypeptidase-like protein
MKSCHGSYNIAGIAVGNGLTDPINMMHYSDFVYQMGLVDTKTYNEFKSREEAIKRAIHEGRRVDAYTVYTTIHTLNYGLPSFLSSMSGSSLFRFIDVAGIWASC